MQFGEVSSKKTYRVLLIILAIIITGYLSYLFFDVIAMLCISVLISMIFNPVVTFLERKGFSRWIASLMVFASGAIVLFSLLSFLVPKITSQLDTISRTVSQENLNKFVKDIETAIKPYMPFVKQNEIGTQLKTFVTSQFTQSLSHINEILSSIMSVLAILIIVPFMTFFLLKDNKRIIRGIVNIMPNKYFEMSYWVLRQIATQLGKFVRGWIFDAFIVGVLSTIGLTILGIDNAISIGLIAGIGHLIPYFGPIIGGLPAIIISLIQFGDFSKLPSILIMFIIIYTVDNGFIQPNIYSKSTDLHPLVIIILIIAASQLIGIVGMLLAVPVATVVKTAAKEIYLGFKNYKVIKV
jgi:predicted PurR-regulated permease PerM